MKTFIKLWFLFYVYSVCISFLVQKLILPKFFPQAHWGHGLLVGGDWISFYKNAVIVAKNIEKYGWNVWSLHPSIDGQIMTGITSFFFAITGIYEPWVLIFYNGILHATAGVVLILILLEFNVDRKIAIISSLPLVFFPSSLTWVSQIHRDGLYILGFLLIFYSMSLLDSNKLKKISISVFTGFLGIFLIYLARQHMVIPLRYVFLIISFFFIIIFLYKLLKKQSYLNAVYKSISTLILFFITFVLYQPSFNETQIQTYNWTREWWVPESIDNLLYSLASARQYLIEHVIKGSAAAIDLDFVPQKASDLIFYTPRALMIGFISPFPDMWFSEGGTAGGTVGRYIAPFETLILWFTLAIFPLAVLKYGKRSSFYLILLLIILFVWLHVISEPNIGTIYRKRYVFIHTLMAFSFSSFLCFVKAKIQIYKETRKAI